MEPPPLVNPDVPGVSEYIDTDLYCVGCGYNLRTLAATGICPECSLPVDASNQEAQHVRWLQGIRRGLGWLMIACVCHLGLLLSYLVPPLLMMLVQAISASMLSRLLSVASLPAEIIGLIGTLMITRLTPYAPPSLQSLRSFVRATVITSFAVSTSCGFLSLVGVLLGSYVKVHYVVSVLTLCLYCAGTVLLILYTKAVLQTIDRTAGAWPAIAMLGTVLHLVMSLTSIAVMYWWVSQASTAGGARALPAGFGMIMLGAQLSYLVACCIMLLFYGRCRRELKCATQTLATYS